MKRLSLLVLIWLSGLPSQAQLVIENAKGETAYTIRTEEQAKHRKYLKQVYNNQRLQKEWVAKQRAMAIELPRSLPFRQWKLSDEMKVVYPTGSLGISRSLPQVRAKAVCVSDDCVWLDIDLLWLKNHDPDMRAVNFGKERFRTVAFYRSRMSAADQRLLQSWESAANKTKGDR